MAEPTLKEQENSSPYDLWPDETSAQQPAEPFIDPLAEPSRTTGETSPFGEPVKPVGDTPFDAPFGQPTKSTTETPFDAPFVPVVYTPESTEENVRNAGLAWSAGIVFFGSVAFMLFVGWIVDLLLGSSPWGIVLGIVIGAAMGFVQFFRISSRIYSPKSSEPKSLMSDHSEE